MAAIIHPSTNQIQFGAPAYAGMLVQDASIKASSNKREIVNNLGEVAALAFFQKKWDVSVNGVTTTYAGDTVGASSASLAGVSFGGLSVTGTVFINSVSAQASNSDAVKVSIEGSAYESITSS